jgi:hypothetical protein
MHLPLTAKWRRIQAAVLPAGAGSTSLPWLRLTGTRAGGRAWLTFGTESTVHSRVTSRETSQIQPLPPGFNRVQTRIPLTQPAPHSMSCSFDSRARTRIGTPFIGRASAGGSTNPRTKLTCKSRRFQHLSQLKRHACAACDGRKHGVDFLRQAGVAGSNRAS